MGLDGRRGGGKGRGRGLLIQGEKQSQEQEGKKWCRKNESQCSKTKTWKRSVALKRVCNLKKFELQPLILKYSPRVMGNIMIRFVF